MVDPYRRRLARDLDRWIERGWVAARHREAILADAARGLPAWTGVGAAAALGAALMALAAVTFVAANWADMARGLRFLVLLAALAASFAGSAFAFSRKAEALGHALLTLGAALFGAAILLTAQTFNIAAYRPTGLLLWSAGALAVALAAPSRPALSLSAAVAAGWTLAEIANPFAPAFPPAFPVLFLLIAGIAAWRGAPVAANFITLALAAWTGAGLADLAEAGPLSELEAAALFTLAAGAGALAFALMRDRGVRTAGVFANWMVFLAVGGGFLLQLPLADYGMAAARQTLGEASLQGRWETLIGAAGGPYFAPALLGMLALIGLALVRAAAGGMSWFMALAASLGALAAAALPGVIQAAGPGELMTARIATGAAIYLLAAALIAHGARARRRFAGVVGVVLFVGQSLHIYVVLFGDLLNTAVFFFAGGALFLGLALAASLWRRRLARAADREG